MQNNKLNTNTCNYNTVLHRTSYSHTDTSQADSPWAPGAPGAAPLARRQFQERTARPAPCVRNAARAGVLFVRGGEVRFAVRNRKSKGREETTSCDSLARLVHFVHDTSMLAVWTNERCRFASG